MVQDVLGGLLLSGSKGAERVQANGDCILLDGRTGIVAVADGSERSPQASRSFLCELADRMGEERAASEEHRVQSFLDAVQTVLDAFPYEERTTFLCLLLNEDGSVFYISGGDSLLFHMDPQGSRILFRNRANMDFAGRSRKINDAGRLSAKKGDLFLIATDGLWDLLNGKGNELIAAFFKELHNSAFHRLPEWMIQQRHPAFQDGKQRPYDDLGILIVDPFTPFRFRSRVILGGTRRRDEKRYQEMKDQCKLPNRYVPLPEKGDFSWIFPDLLHLLQGTSS